MHATGRVCNNIIVTMSTGEKKSVRFYGAFLNHLLIIYESSSFPFGSNHAITGARQIKRTVVGGGEYSPC